MRKTILTLLAAAPVSAAPMAMLLAFTTGANVAHAEIAWESKLRKAHSRASQEGKLLLLHFTRDNCVYCDKLEEGAFATDAVSDAVAANFVPVKVNVSDSRGNKKLGEMFKVDRFPMDVVVTTEGEALVHSVSPQDPQLYVAMLNKTLSNPTPLQRPGTPGSPGAAPQQQIARAPAARPAPTQVAAPQTQVAAAPAQPQAAPAQVAQAPAPQTQAPQDNTWALPPQAPSQSVAANTVSNRSGEMSLSMPAQANVAPPSIAPPKQASAPAKPSAPKAQVARTSSTPELAMDGFCAVTVIEEARWVEGKPDFGVIHLGKLYLFDSKSAMDSFLADPIPYTPILNEIDVVRFFEERKIVKGKREFAMQDPLNNRMFFFADEAAMSHFENEWARYVDAAVNVMDKAVQESNPGS